MPEPAPLASNHIKKNLLPRVSTIDSLAMGLVIPHSVRAFGASRGARADTKLHVDTVHRDISDAGSDCGVVTLAPPSRLTTENGDAIANSL